MASSLERLDGALRERPQRELRRTRLSRTRVHRWLCSRLPCRLFGLLLDPFEHPLLHDEVGDLDAQ